MAHPDLGGVVRVEGGGHVETFVAEDDLDVVLAHLNRRELARERPLARVGAHGRGELAVVRSCVKRRSFLFICRRIDTGIN